MVNPSGAFTCAGSGFAAVQGANTLSIDPNGALRVHSSGFALNLPSLIFTANADVTVTGGVFTGAVLHSAAGSVSLGDQFDEFAMNTTAGSITGIRFARRRNGATLSQSCGVI
jgi:hypothetical protein